MINSNNNLSRTNLNPIDQDYFYGLDSLRALSVLLVIIGHIYYNDGSFVDKLHLGAVGVDVFFVISGFLITTLIIKELKKNGKFDVKSFFLRRAFRILPVVFLFSLVLLLIDLIYGIGISLNSYLSGLFFYKQLTNFSDFWFNAHLWSLSVEEQFYIIFPSLLFVFGSKTYLRILFIFLILSNFVINCFTIRKSSSNS